MCYSNISAYSLSLGAQKDTLSLLFLVRGISSLCRAVKLRASRISSITAHTVVRSIDNHGCSLANSYLLLLSNAVTTNSLRTSTHHLVHVFGASRIQKVHLILALSMPILLLGPLRTRASIFVCT